MKKIILVLFFVALMGSVPVSAKQRPLKEKLEKASEWIFKAMKEFEFVQEEVSLLAEVIYHENWHTDKEKRAAYLTGAVVLNRRNSPKYPNTVKGVLYEKGQYSTTYKFFTKELPDEVYVMARQIYYHGTPDVPENVVYQAQFKQGSGKYDIINGEWFCYG